MKVLLIIVLLYALMSQVHQSVELCQEIGSINDIARVDGVYTNNGFITFYAKGRGIDTLFHEMCHKNIDEDYPHFCEVYK